MTGDRASAAARDGAPLAVTRFAAREPAWATLVIAGAMGVRQDFYAPLAAYLAAQGVHVLTFDYRGMGWSRAGGLRGCDADLRAWAEQDLDAMLLAAHAMAPELPLAYVGHSLGGQLLGVLPHRERVDAAITVTAGSGWYKLNDRMPLEVRVFWFAAIPALTPLFGYFPGKALRMVGDLPRGVAWQWRRWCLHEDYLLCEGEEWRRAYAAYARPVLSYSFEDDRMINAAAVDDLHRRYASAAVERRHLAPADVGERHVGHFGFFAARSRGRLWRPALDWLKEKTCS